MKYRVVFRERAAPKGRIRENPIGFLQGGRSDSVVRKSTFVLRHEPEFKRSADPLEDDADFRHLGTETWEFEVAEGKDQEFKDALLNSGSMVEFAPIGVGETS
jgi:hypothetical protein